MFDDFRKNLLETLKEESEMVGKVVQYKKKKYVLFSEKNTEEDDLDIYEEDSKIYLKNFDATKSILEVCTAKDKDILKLNSSEWSNLKIITNEPPYKLTDIQITPTKEGFDIILILKR